jgi:opacity protein-like surface antigen
MKHIAVMIVFGIGLAVLPAMSQTQRGSWELSAAANFGTTSNTYESTSGGHTSTGKSEGRGYLGLDFRAGVYVVEGLSIEPEIYFLAVEKDLPTFNLGGNVAYTFTIPDSPVRPFAIAGYGIGNGIPQMQRLMGRTSGDLDIPVLRVGGGLKVFLAQQVALKVEYRYERYSYESTTTYFNTTSTYSRTWNFHNVLFGFAVFLPAAG